MKKKNLKKTQKLKIMAALLSGGMLAVLSPNAAYALEGTADNNYTVTITDGMNIMEDVYGNKGNPDPVTGNITGHVKITGGTLGSEGKDVSIYGGYFYSSRGKYLVKNNIVEISGGTIYGNVYGGCGCGRDYGGTQNTDIRDAVDNKVYITGGTIYGDIYGGYDGSRVNEDSAPYKEGVARNEVWLAGGKIVGSVTAGTYRKDSPDENAPVHYNKIYLTGDTDVSEATLIGTGKQNKGLIEKGGNDLVIDGWNGTKIKGLRFFHSIIFENIDLNKATLLEVKDPIDYSYFNHFVDTDDNTKVYLNSIKAGDYAEDTLNKTIQWDEDMCLQASKNRSFAVVISDDLKKGITGYYYGNRENNGIFINHFTNLTANDSTPEDSKIEFTGTVDKTVLAGAYVDENGEKHGNTNNTSWDTSDDITYLTIEDGLKTNASVVTGVYAVGGKNASGGKTYINGNYDGTVVYAGYAEGNGSTENNYIYIGNGVNAAGTKLLGNNKTSGNSGATLEVSGNGNELNSIGRFDDINFNNVTLNGDTVLKVTDADLDGTKVNVKTLASGPVYHEGDRVTLLNSQNAITGNVENIGINDDIVQAGVAQELTVSASQSDANNIDLTVTSVKLSEQTNLVAETRAASVGLLNQGTDLIADSINTISRDGKYGVKTFAAVYGNRSKYDVADDVKINGWSMIVGVGVENEHNGGDFSWGVFYENGSGNYRTYNGFDNELFRGDGSIVYNGGGIAARYENSHGVYTEGSLHAGMLKNEADNALFCGETGYGYETESAYYGAHIGVGKIWQLGDNSELDVYGKFFHTYVEGDTVHIAQDEFDLDSINSDRLRIGARITNNKENKFSTYYGLAYEYEFNGDADMRAAGMKAPTRSLQGSSVMAEIGLNYQPTPNSPWSFDLNMRGYTGERQGGSFNVQATYTF